MKEKVKASWGGLKAAFMVTVALLLICGLIYPLAMTGLAQVLFPHQANGSLIAVNGQAVGSKLVGQDFTKDYFMKCRPSAVNYNTYTDQQKEDGDYGGVASGSNNYGPSNPDLVTRVEEDITEFLDKNPQLTVADIPTDLVTASGSGLDPHISPASAEVQLEMLSKASGLSMDSLKTIVANHTEGKVLGVFGENRVNVLQVNIEIAQQMGLISTQK